MSRLHDIYLKDKAETERRMKEIQASPEYQEKKKRNHDYFELLDVICNVTKQDIDEYEPIDALNYLKAHPDFAATVIIPDGSIENFEANIHAGVYLPMTKKYDEYSGPENLQHFIDDYKAGKIKADYSFTCGTFDDFVREVEAEQNEK